MTRLQYCLICVEKLPQLPLSFFVIRFLLCLQLASGLRLCRRFEISANLSVANPPAAIGRPPHQSTGCEG